MMLSLSKFSKLKYLIQWHSENKLNKTKVSVHFIYVTPQDVTQAQTSLKWLNQG